MHSPIDIDAGKPRMFTPTLFHLLAIYPAFLVGVLVSLPIVAILPATGQQVSVSGRLLEEPFWVPEIAAGFCAGWFFYKRLPSKIALMAWIAPAVFLGWSAWSWHQTASMYDHTWETYFGSQCGGSDCIYQLFLTGPFYTSVAYSLAAAIEKIARARGRG
jgi:hypothetical protein